MDFDCNRVHIKKDNKSFCMTINDIPIKNVKYVEFRAGVDEVSTVIVEFYTEETEIETEVDG